MGQDGMRKKDIIDPCRSISDMRGSWFDISPKLNEADLSARWHPERDKEITRRVLEGEDLGRVAEDCDLTVARIRQIVHGVVAAIDTN